ncbi:MAG: hypothetical protein Q6K55_09260 [Thermostichus sp. DG02_3_bins_51]
MNIHQIHTPGQRCLDKELGQQHFSVNPQPTLFSWRDVQPLFGGGSGQNPCPKRIPVHLSVGKKMTMRLYFDDFSDRVPDQAQTLIFPLTRSFA